MSLTVALIARVYAFMATPQYKVSVVLRPEAINELDALNRSEAYQLPADALRKGGRGAGVVRYSPGFLQSQSEAVRKLRSPCRNTGAEFRIVQPQFDSVAVARSG
ncbi:hypothetical protein [Pseudomonas sp. TWRC1-2]|uniref:hypothetical protein n=1 Tax=Pseudomonas sp. TWRC1-2 TaxID=2804628 RepID=UPI003CF68D4F